MEPVRVLVADDNPAARESLVSSLGRLRGMQVVGVAENGVEAMRLVRERLPDVMICDMVMPQKDGFGVLEEVAHMEASRRPRVIALTALSRDDFISRAIGLGAAYYMVKPADIGFLSRQIMKLAGRSAAEQEAREKAEEVNEQEVAGLLLRVGVPAHLSGYRFLLRAVTMVLDRPEYLGSITRELYPAVARSCDTMASCVERSIRHAIQVTWERGGAAAFEQIMNRRMFSGNEKPTNCELIALLSERVRLQGWV